MKIDYQLIASLESFLEAGYVVVLVHALRLELAQLVLEQLGLGSKLLMAVDYFSA